MTPSTAKPRDLVSKLFSNFVPPKELKLSEWADNNIRLPEGASARPGAPYKTWAYMREPFDVIGDSVTENVTILKSARIGYTAGICVAIGARAVTDPAPAILLMPTDEDAKGIAVDQIEPLFQATDTLRSMMRRGVSDGRNTMTRKNLQGGASLKILSARAPRKLRRHDCRDLYIDEADGMEVTKEGDPIKLAIARTLAQAGRKIVVGSTPTEEGISIIDARYELSDKRIYEVPCRHCGVFSEILWEHIVCREEHNPETAEYLCPKCNLFVPERHKPWMVENGRWRATRPDVKNHAGFRINALVSLLANATWPQLMRDWFEAKRGGPAEIQVFVNTVLGRTFRTSVNAVDADVLAQRAEPFGLDRMPREVLMLTAGVDVQDDRLEIVVLGWPRFGGPYVLAHLTLDGNTLDDAVWSRLDAWLLKSTWKSPRGWRLKIDACAVDSGGSEGRTQRVYDWCAPRLARRVYAIKGVPGPRKVWEKAKKVKGDARMFNVAVDVLKTDVLDAFGRDPYPEEKKGDRDARSARFSNDLTDEFYVQVTNEVRRLKYKGRRPVYVFELKKVGIRNEALDCTVYAWAVRLSPGVRSIDLAAREAREPDPEDGVKAKKKSAADWGAAFNG